MNVVWERISDVSATLEIPEQLWRKDTTKYATFKTARKWANFMKHPGFFGLGVHHPLYVAGGSQAAKVARETDDKRPTGATEWVLIDTDFVAEHWSGDTARPKLEQTLRGSCTACVVLPDVKTMAPELNTEFAGFVERMKEPTWVELARRHAVAELPCDWW